MGKFVGVVGSFLLAAALSGCATVSSPVGMGCVFTSVSYAGEGGGAQLQKGAVLKTGRSSCNNILGLIATGDASIEKAMREAGISHAVTIDHESFDILFLFSSYSTVVRGE